MLLLQKVSLLHAMLISCHVDRMSVFLSSEDVPDLKGMSYADFRLDKRDWEKLKLMHKVLQVRYL